MLNPLLQAFQDLLDAIPDDTLQADLPLRAWRERAASILNEYIYCPACDKEGATAGACLAHEDVHTCVTERQAERQAIIYRIHVLSGICGHCGKRKCHGKASHSTLPDKLRTDDVLLAIAGPLKETH